MIAVLQRVSSAEVLVCGRGVGKCGRGLLILLGVADGDSAEDVLLLASKILKLRIFSDESGKMNLSVTDVGGEVLVISNFTLLANYRKGNRPDYLRSATPDKAKELYDYFVSEMKKHIKTESGQFGADMQVSLINDGPVTIVMDSNVLKKS